MVIVSIHATNDHEGDMRTLDRITRGIERMSESGYIVERYDNFSREKGKKLIIAVQRTEDSNDAEFEKWLYSKFSGT
ncbi:MAG: hypothetical protein FWC70_08200 [Defluviitaleaceae bacterium]|nr:hypothetical protein [Defluviitaleaceae bacterium]